MGFVFTCELHYCYEPCRVVVNKNCSISLEVLSYPPLFKFSYDPYGQKHAAEIGSFCCQTQTYANPTRIDMTS